MLTFDTKLMCVYGLRPNQSDGEILSTEKTQTRILEDFLAARKKASVRVRLFPRESQPSSSTCWWTIGVKPRGFFRKNKCCKITECVGTRTFTSAEGKYSIDGDDIVVNGRLEDDSLAGKYFLLRLKNSNGERNLPAVVQYEGTLSRSRDSDALEGDWEITHDAMVFGEQLTTE